MTSFSRNIVKSQLLLKPGSGPAIDHIASHVSKDSYIIKVSYVAFIALCIASCPLSALQFGPQSCEIPVERAAITASPEAECQVLELLSQTARRRRSQVDLEAATRTQ